MTAILPIPGERPGFTPNQNVGGVAPHHLAAAARILAMVGNGVPDLTYVQADATRLSNLLLTPQPQQEAAPAQEAPAAPADLSGLAKIRHALWSLVGLRAQ